MRRVDHHPAYAWYPACSQLDRMDIAVLIAREHVELDQMWSEVATNTDRRRSDAFVVARLGQAAHADALAKVLQAARPETAELCAIAAQVLADHREHERIVLSLARLSSTEPRWLETLDGLRTMLVAYARDVQTYLFPLLREQLSEPRYQALASVFATERLRAFEMLSAILWPRDQVERQRMGSPTSR